MNQLKKIQILSINFYLPSSPVCGRREGDEGVEELYYAGKPSPPTPLPQVGEIRTSKKDLSGNKSNTLLLQKLFLFIILTTLSIAGCSLSSLEKDQSTYVKASLKEGKADFKAKNYSAAYRELLPYAVKGNKDAQYAVGYMYYYGEGIDHNTDLAESWLQKAAKKGEKQAISLLKEIEEHKKQPVVKEKDESE